MIGNNINELFVDVFKMPIHEPNVMQIGDEITRTGINGIHSCDGDFSNNSRDSIK